LTNEEQLLIAIKADTTNLMGGLKTASSGISNFNKKIAGIGKGMTIAGAAIVGGFAMAIKTASGFEQSMANTASVAGATKEELELLTAAAREQGEQSVYSASQAADAQYYLASAGMNTNEIIGALEGTMSLAAATQSDLAYTSASVAASLSQFGLEADEAGRVANVFAAGISGSQATMEKLTTSMSYVGPMAHSMGMTIEDTTGILMNLYNAGLDGSKAGTSLRMAFVKLIDPTEKGTNALENLGVSIKDSEGNMRPFKNIIDDLGIAGMTTADAMDIFGIRSGPAMMALVNQGTGAIQEMTEAVTDTQKATEMTETQIDTFQGTMKLLKSAFEELQISLVQDLMPALRPLIDSVTEGIKKVSEWIKENPKLTATIVKLAAVIGAAAMVGGPILMAVSSFGAVSGAITAIGTLTTGPIGLLVAAITGIILVWKNWDKIKTYVKGFVDKIIGFLNDLKELGIKKVKEFVTGIFNKFKELANLPKKMMEWGKNAITGFTDGIKNKMSSITNAVKGVGDKIKDFLGFHSPPKEGPLSDSDTWMPNMMGMFGEGITDNLDLVYKPVETLSTGFMNKFTKLKNDFKSNIVDPIMGYLENQLANAIVSVLDNTSDFEWSWKSFWEGLKRVLINAVAAMIAKLVVLAAFQWLFPFLSFDTGGGVDYNLGGNVKGFASGGGTDTIPAMLTPGEYVIAKPMTDFIRKFKAIPATLTAAIAGGLPTPTPAFAGGGLVGNNYNGYGIEHSETKIYVDIHDNRISDDVDIRQIASTVSEEILRKINFNRRH